MDLSNWSVPHPNENRYKEFSAAMGVMVETMSQSREPTIVGPIIREMGTASEVVAHPNV